jgi:uncharacterized protein with ParB-like and HNH nuclease domain
LELGLAYLKIHQYIAFLKQELVLENSKVKTENLLLADYLFEVLSFPCGVLVQKLYLSNLINHLHKLHLQEWDESLRYFSQFDLAGNFS